MNTLYATFSVVLMASSFSLLYAADSWTDFRGPGGDGHAAVKSAPLRWSEDTHVKWKTKLPGRAWSSPVVLDGQVWVTDATEDGHKLSAVCLSLETGEVRHNPLLFEVPNPQVWGNAGKAQSHGSPSPVIEPGRVYVHFGTYGTACLDTKTGKTLWTRSDIKVNHMEGAGSSPILWKHFLILTYDGADHQFSIALNKKDGTTAWKTDRSIDFGNTVPDRQKSFSTPIIVGKKKDQLVIPAAWAIYGYDAATGKELWRADYRNKGFSVGSRPVADDHAVYFTTGYMQSEVLAVKLGGSGNVTDTHILWRTHRSAPRISSPILIGKHLYTSDDKGFVSCRDTANGKTLWSTRLDARVSSSPIYAAGQLYLFDQNGTAHVMKPGDAHKALAANTLDSGFMASAAAIEGSLILRTKTHIYRIQD